MPLPTEFTAQTDKLQANAAAAAAAAGLPGVVARTWQLPAGLVPTSDPTQWDVQDPANLRLALIRVNLNQAYVDALAPGHGVGEGQAYKTAVDYLASLERALQARHAGRQRCLRWAAARRAGHGDPTAGVFGLVRDDLTATLGAAGAG